MNYLEVLDRFEGLVENNEHYVKREDAKFLISEILNDYKRYLEMEAKIKHSFEWTKEDEETLRAIRGALLNYANYPDEGPYKDHLISLLNWLDDFSYRVRLKNVEK